ncbi:unnamed protein product [Prunus brigantina]
MHHSGRTFAVDLNAHSCSCHAWDLNGIPYQWMKVNLPPLLPPKYHKQPGRPKKTRKQAVEEPKQPSNPYKLPRYGIPLKCGNCGGEGHNRSSCKEPRNPNIKPTRKRNIAKDKLAVRRRDGGDQSRGQQSMQLRQRKHSSSSQGPSQSQASQVAAASLSQPSEAADAFQSEPSEAADAFQSQPSEAADAFQSQPSQAPEPAKLSRVLLLVLGFASCFPDSSKLWHVTKGYISTINFGKEGRLEIFALGLNWSKKSASVLTSHNDTIGHAVLLLASLLFPSSQIFYSTIFQFQTPPQSFTNNDFFSKFSQNRRNPRILTTTLFSNEP